MDGVLWVFSPAKAATLAQAPDRVPSAPLGQVDVIRLATRLGVDFVSVAPDHLLPSALNSRRAAYRYSSVWLGPSRFAFFDPPASPLSGDADAAALMSADSARFTGVPRETAPEEYAPSGELLKNNANARGSRKRSSPKRPAWPVQRSPASKRGTISHTPEWSGYWRKR